MLGIIFLVFAFVLLVMAAANVNHPRVHLGWLGLALWVLSLLLGGVGNQLFR